MKRLITILAVVFCSAVQNVQAKDIAYLNNEGGGRIVLTDEVCRSNGQVYNNLNRVYTYTSTGFTMGGCYTLDNSMIWVIFENGQERRFPAGVFTLINQPKRSGSGGAI